ncbi:MAG: hypothetical protein HYT87_14855 [Nitrospirae bacterium]|nr:hypothetical protein [Nitrospirota bacterium]
MGEGESENINVQDMKNLKKRKGAWAGSRPHKALSQSKGAQPSGARTAQPSGPACRDASASCGAGRDSLDATKRGVPVLSFLLAAAALCGTAACAPPEPATYIIYIEAEKSLTSAVERFAPVARIDRGESVLDDGVPVGFQIGEDGASYVSLGFEGRLGNAEDPVTLTLHDRRVDLIGVKLMRARNSEGVLTRDGEATAFPDSDEDGVENLIEAYLGTDPFSKGQRPPEDQAQKIAEDVFPELASQRKARSTGNTGGAGAGDPGAGVDTKITTKPSKPVSSDAVTIRFIAVGKAEGARLECSVDDGAFGECVSPLTLTGLAEGPHRLRVRAVAGDGEVDATPAEAVVVVDRTPPATKITGTPSGVKNEGKVSLQFESTEAGSAFLCSVDQSPVQACSPGQGVSVGSDGRHTIRVFAMDAAGNRDPVGAEAVVDVDLTPPTVKWLAAPAAVTNRTEVTVTAAAEDRAGVAVIECAVRGAAEKDQSPPPLRSTDDEMKNHGVFTSPRWEACGSGMMVRGLAEGAFVAMTRAKDRAGNVSAVLETAFIVDLTAPAVRIKEGPAEVSAMKQVSFVLEGSEDVETFRCGMDEEWSACGGTWSVPSVPEGRHLAQAEGVDKAGNVGRSEAYAFTIDRSPPEIRVVSGPVDGTNQSSVVFRMGITDALSGGARLECSADGGAFSDCLEKGVTFSSLTTGAHVLAVRAADGAGNAAASKFTFVVDRTAPTVTASVAAGWLKSPGAVMFSAADDSGVAPAVDYCFALGAGSCVPSVRAVDGVGEISCEAGAICEGNVHFTAVDRAGNRSEVVRVSVKVDAQGPMIGGDVAFTMMGTRGASLSARFDDAGVGEVKDCLLEFADSAGVTSQTKAAVGGVCSVSRACERKGPLVLGVVALDAVGNGSALVERTMTCDSAPPATSITFGPDVKESPGRFIDGGPGFTTRRYPFAVTDGDGVGPREVRYWVTGMSGEASCLWTSPGGCGFEVACLGSVCLGTVRFYSVDQFGNEEALKAVAYTIDRKGPVFAFVADGELYGRDAAVLSSKGVTLRACGNFYASDTTTTVARYEAGLSQGVSGCGRSDVSFAGISPSDALRPAGCVSMAGRPANNRYCFTVKAYDEFGNVGCASSCDREAGVYFFDNGGLGLFSPAEVVVQNRSDGASVISIGGPDKVVRYSPLAGGFEKVTDLAPVAAGPEAVRMGILDDGCVQTFYETPLPTEVRVVGCPSMEEGVLSGAEALLGTSKGSFWVTTGANALIGFGTWDPAKAVAVSMTDVLPLPKEGLTRALASTSSSSTAHVKWVATGARSSSPGSAFSIRRIVHPSHEISILDASALSDGQNTYALEGIALVVVEEAGESLVIAQGVRQTNSGFVRKLFYGFTTPAGTVAMRILGDGASGFPVAAVLPGVCSDAKRIVVGVGSGLIRGKLDLGTRAITGIETSQYPGWVFQSLGADMECQVYGTVIADGARYVVTP